LEYLFILKQEKMNNTI